MSMPTPPAVPGGPFPPPPPPHPGYAPGYPPAYGAPMADAATMMRYDANKKSAGIGYLLWFFFGVLGVHRFYLGATGTGAAQLILCIVSFVLTFVAVGLIGFVALGIWVFVDLFLIPGLARSYNNNLASRLMGGGYRPMA